jgi:hypothetical protein
MNLSPAFQRLNISFVGPNTRRRASLRAAVDFTAPQGLSAGADGLREIRRRAIDEVAQFEMKPMKDYFGKTP